MYPMAQVLYANILVKLARDDSDDIGYFLSLRMFVSHKLLAKNVLSLS